MIKVGCQAQCATHLMVMYRSRERDLFGEVGRVTCVNANMADWLPDDEELRPRWSGDGTWTLSVDGLYEFKGDEYKVKW